MQRNRGSEGRMTATEAEVVDSECEESEVSKGECGEASERCGYVVQKREGEESRKSRNRDFREDVFQKRTHLHLCSRRHVRVRPAWETARKPSDLNRATVSIHGPLYGPVHLTMPNFQNSSQHFFFVFLKRIEERDIPSGGEKGQLPNAHLKHNNKKCTGVLSL